MSLWNVEKDHVMTAIPGMLHGHQMHIVGWRFWGTTRLLLTGMNGAWEVKGDEHAVPVRGVVDQFVRWFLGGTFRQRTDESDWCRQIFRESNNAADTHANWLMDNCDSGPGAQWMAPDLHDKMENSRHIVLSFDGARRGSGLGVVTG